MGNDGEKASSLMQRKVVSTVAMFGSSVPILVWNLALKGAGFW